MIDDDGTWVVFLFNHAKLMAGNDRGIEMNKLLVIFLALKRRARERVTATNQTCERKNHKNPFNKNLKSLKIMRYGNKWK